MQLVLHAPFGARINRAWGLALRKRFCRSFNLELQAGEQFARPEAIELLRAVHRAEEPGEEVEISVADPLNLVGIILPGQRISALAGGTLHLRDGVPGCTRVAHLCAFPDWLRASLRTSQVALRTQR